MAQKSVAEAKPANKGGKGVAGKRLSGGTVLAYSLGDVANNLSFLMTSMFLMIFMTDIAGISAGIAGTIYLITKVWAGICDLTAGQVVDRPRTRWGTLRPWLLWVSGPLALVFVLLFSVPYGWAPDGSARVVAWVLLFDCAFQLCYSFTNIPYGSLSAAMTQDPVDRSRLSGARSIASSATGVILSLVVAPQFQDTAADGIRQKFTIIMATIAVVAIILYLICFAKSKEVVPRSTGKMSMKRTFKMVGQNKPLLILCSGAFFVLAAMFTMNAVGMYYAREILGSAGYWVFLMLSQTVGTIIVASIVPTITVRFGKRNGYLCCAVLTAISFVLIFFVPNGGLPIAIIAWFLFGFASGGTNALMFSMQADTVDYGEWKSGVRAEGGSYSVLSFIRKCGQGLGGWAGAFVIGLFGYNKAGADIEQVQLGIKVAIGLLPAALALIAVIIMLRYPLSADLHAQIVSELNERRTQSAVSEAAGVETEAVVVEKEVGDGRTTLLRKAGTGAPPIVTIFGLRGSGATDIGPMVAKELGVPYVQQAFSSEQLAKVDASALISDSGFDRWLRKISYTGTQDSLLSAAADQAYDHTMASNNTQTVLKAVSNGGVLLGRNGALVLGKVVGAMHIRLVAPIGKRIERVSQQTGLPAYEAQEQCEAEDRIRAEMSHKLYQWDPNSDEYYDMVINTATVTYEQVARMIARFYLSKYPDAKPTVEAATSGVSPAIQEEEDFEDRK